MLRRRALPLLLAFFLLLSQQMGMAHGVSHISHIPPDAASSHDQTLPAEIQCEQCLVFASLSAAPPALLPVIALHQSKDIVSPGLYKQILRTCAIPAFESRAPPTRFF